MIKASSLLYAVIISLVLAIISASVIFSQYFHIIESENDLIQSRLRVNCISAINYELVSDDYLSISHKQLSLYDGVQDSVDIRIDHWGVLDLVYANAFIGNRNISKTALVGDAINNVTCPALYLADNNTPLLLCGKTIIHGDCFLPKTGVKRAFIEGQNFLGTKLIDGKISTAASALPPIDKAVLDHIIALSLYRDSIIDSLSTNENHVDSYRNFQEATKVISSEKSIYLNNQAYGGKIIIISKKEVRISSSASISDILIFAPKIIVENNFEGSCQLFASDSIYIGKKVNLKYPSVVSTISSDKGNKYPKIVVDEETRIGGLVLMEAGYDPINKVVNLNLGKKSIIIGVVYCNGIVNMNGAVIGSLYCQKFLLKTASGTYENHLLNSTIDIIGMPERFALRSFSREKSDRRVIKWL